MDTITTLEEEEEKEEEEEEEEKEEEEEQKPCFVYLLESVDHSATYSDSLKTGESLTAWVAFVITGDKGSRLSGSFSPSVS
jgi:hypothetical protein